MNDWRCPKLHRLRGEALVNRNFEAARHSFEQALSIAREVGAKTWEQQAASRLSELECPGAAPAQV